MKFLIIQWTVDIIVISLSLIEVALDLPAPGGSHSPTQRSKHT